MRAGSALPAQVRSPVCPASSMTDARDDVRRRNGSDNHIDPVTHECDFGGQLITRGDEKEGSLAVVTVGHAVEAAPFVVAAEKREVRVDRAVDVRHAEPRGWCRYPCGR